MITFFDLFQMSLTASSHHVLLLHLVKRIRVALLNSQTTDDTVHSHGLAQLSKRNKFISRLDYSAAHPQHRLELEAATPWEIASLEAVLDFLPPSDAKWDREVKGVVSVKWGDLATPRWISATGLYKVTPNVINSSFSFDFNI